MLAQGANDEAAFFSASRILEQPIHDSLLRLVAPLSLGGGNLDEALVNTLDGQWLWFPQRETLLLLGLKCDIPRITVLVVEGLEGSVVKATHLAESFGNGRPAESKL
jgi:hypothetical protein